MRSIRNLNLAGLTLDIVVSLSVAFAIRLFYRRLDNTEAARCGLTPDAARIDAEHWQELAATAK